jgi:hypothetical protein
MREPGRPSAVATAAGRGIFSETGKRVQPFRTKSEIGLEGASGCRHGHDADDNPPSRATTTPAAQGCRIGRLPRPDLAVGFG